MRGQRNSIVRIISFLLVILILSGCAKIKSPSGPSEKIIATVNGEPIYVKDLKRELALRVKSDPTFKVTPDTLKEQIDIMVNRRLIIQEAMRKKLAEEDRFVNTIKTFWEQTLIRDFVDYKNKEFESYVFVTEDEIKDYYDKLKEKGQVELPPFEEAYPRIRVELKEEKQRQAFEEWLLQTREKADIKINPEVLKGEK